MIEDETLELCLQVRQSVKDLFHITYDGTYEWENGTYFSLYVRPSKRVRAILSVERELLILGNVYADQQARTIACARQIIKDSKGRLEPHLFFIVHKDPRGNSKLKNWGREFHVSVIPIYAGTEQLPTGQDFERLLAYEFFSQDPFDVTGPVVTDAQFFGRRTEAQELARKLQSGQIRACFGIRKIGKTSILHRVLQDMDANFDAITIFIDCSQDGIFQLRSHSLLLSIAHTIDAAMRTKAATLELLPAPGNMTLEEASRALIAGVEQVRKPLVIMFDEVDYITPASPVAPHWKSDFIDFWRNMRAAYQAAMRTDRKLSIVVSGVSSKWFAVESIDGIENAALAFVPEEYLSPLPRGAAVAMIRSMGPLAGLNFDEASAERVASTCSDLPFWIRKACAFLHARIDASARPLRPVAADVASALSDFIRDEGAAMAQVALQHLFRVYPELRGAALEALNNQFGNIKPSVMRVLFKYGLVTADGKKISGEMVESGLRLVFEEGGNLEAVSPPEVDANTQQRLALEISEWAEELQTIGRRRNLIERKLREFVANFLRFSSLNAPDGPSAKDRILATLLPRRRDEVAGLPLDELVQKLYWLDLKAIISREWSVFGRIFNDRVRMTENFDLINDRPDAHAKNIDYADVALYRRTLAWFEEKLQRIDA